MYLGIFEMITVYPFTRARQDVSLQSSAPSTSFVPWYKNYDDDDDDDDADAHN